MVQVIQLHPYKDSYPFGLQKQSQFTYVQLIKQLTSQAQLSTYKQNLALFKSMENELIIKLDSYIKENNSLQLYYQYESMSMKSYLQQRLVLIADDYQRDKFLSKIITNINLSIQEIIMLLTSKKILAILSIQNMAITKGQRIKFFIQPDFDYVQKPRQSQLAQYYTTQRKKLQIQLQQFLQHIFESTNSKPKQHSKANFVIQGTKLVFVNEQQKNRQSITSNMNPINTNNNKQSLLSQNITNSNISNNSNHSNNSSTNRYPQQLPQYMLKQPLLQQLQQNYNNNNNNSSRQKFDIKNILDEKKLHKNNQPSSQFTSNSIQGRRDSRGGGGKQLFTSGGISSINSNNNQKQYNNSKRSFQENQQQRKQRYQEQRKQRQRQIKNYFDNNDDFNKDASFYPQQFIKEDSIAEFQGYQDQLQRQLQDLKTKQYQAEQIANTSKNRLSMIPNTQVNTSGNQQKMMNKTPTSQQIIQGKPFPHSISLKYPITPPYQQNGMNSSNSQQQDTSTQLKQKKKYKVTITTSHQVDVDDDDDDVDLRDIEKELIEDIRNGNLKSTNDNNKQSQQNTPTLTKGASQKESSQFAQNLPIHLLKGHTRQTHNPSSSHDVYNSFPPTQSNGNQKPTSLNSIGSSQNDEHAIDQRPFSKQHPHIISQTGQYVYLNKDIKDANSYNSAASTHAGNLTTPNTHQTPDIKNIIQKIKNNSKSQQNNSNSNSFQQQSNASQSIQNVKSSYQNQVQQDIRPHSHISSHGAGKDMIQGEGKSLQQQQYDKQYYDKIQKAKLKAEQIMKLVKQRKAQ